MSNRFKNKFSMTYYYIVILYKKNKMKENEMTQSLENSAMKFT